MFVEEDGSTDEGFVYVPIEGEGCSEAIFLEINLKNGEESVCMLEWGHIKYTDFLHSPLPFN